jgi:hypothetical protein
VNQRIRFTGPRAWQRAPTSEAGPAVGQQNGTPVGGEAPATLPTSASVPPSSAGRDAATWQSSSFDLVNGLHVSDFEDTVPSVWLDALGL